MANIGSADRTLRFVLGVGLIGLGIIYQTAWGLVGLLPLLTATIRWCPAYAPFGINTCKKTEDSHV